MKPGELYKIARKESESEGWKTILRTTRDRVRFEDGFVHGWNAQKKYAKAQRRQQRRKEK